jgi:EpsI family protein
VQDRLRFKLSLGLLIGAFILIHFRPTDMVRPVPVPLEELPWTISDWQARGSESLDPKALEILQVSDYLLRRYTDTAGDSLSLFIGLWASQKKGAQIHSPLNCLPGSGWMPKDSVMVEVPLHDPPGKMSVNCLQVEKNSSRQIVFYWYQYQDKAIAGEIPARLQMIKNSLFRNRTDAILIRIVSPLNGDQPRVKPEILDFIAELHGQILRMYKG